MSKLDNDLGESLELSVRPRESEPVSIQIPKDTLESLKKVANQRDMPLEALLKFYIGKCLRQNLRQAIVLSDFHQPVRFRWLIVAPI